MVMDIRHRFPGNIQKRFLETVELHLPVEDGLELTEPVSVVPAAFGKHLCSNLSGRFLLFKIILHRSQLCVKMSGVLLLESIDEVLEIQTIPFRAEPFHDFDPPVRIVPAVFGALDVGSFLFRQIVAANQIPVLVVDVYHTSGNLVVDSGETVGTVDPVLHGPVENESLIAQMTLYETEFRGFED